jgi:hypothetical protein
MGCLENVGFWRNRNRCLQQKKERKHDRIKNWESQSGKIWKNRESQSGKIWKNKLKRNVLILE